MKRMYGSRLSKTYGLHVLLVLLLMVIVAGCGKKPAPQNNVQQDASAGQEQTDGVLLDLSGIKPIGSFKKLNVVATTSIVADVVSSIGGDEIKLTILMPAGTDPHTFEPTSRDVSDLTKADVVFVNGVGLEAFLEPTLESSGANKGKVISVSQGVELRTLGGREVNTDGLDHDHSGSDPHVWFSPLNVKQWAKNIEQTLVYADPKNADTYVAQSQTYQNALTELDDWIKEKVEQVPQTSRKFLADHNTLGYFADRYGFRQVGTVVPGYSTLSEPSAQEIAELEDLIRQYKIAAIFVGATSNPDLAERIAGDTGIKLLRLYTGSLSEEGGRADTYIDMMRYDTKAIVEGLR